MDDLILPVDADETTCIPVEIRYGKENNGEIKVHFSNGKEVSIKEKKELEFYVHNRYNPGNEQGVSHIVVLKDNELLANNLVLVDLPGVGSLTPQNVKITMDYVEKLSAAIFLLRTVPPITKHEQIFLTNVWPKLTQAWFVQNQWNDESKDEVEDGKQHNQYVLEQIAKKHQTSENIDIQVINVYQALNAKLQNDAHAYKKSGLQEFRNYLEEISKNWGTLLTEQFSESIRMLIQEMIETINKQIDEAKMTTDELQKKQKIEEQKYEQVFQDNKKIINQIEDLISSKKLEIYDFVSVESKMQMENLRNEMRRVIGSGLTDGHLLNKAYQDHESNIAQETMDKLSMKIFEIQKELMDHLEELEVKDTKGKFQKTGSFNRKQEFKGEKSLPYIASIGGGMGGYAAGMATAAKVGGMIGTTAGPLGTAVGVAAGAIVGLGIVFISGWIGNKAKKTVNEIRQSYTIKDLEKPLRDFRGNLKETIEGAAGEAFDHIEQTLADFKQVQQKMIDNEKQKNIQQLLNHSKDNEKQLAKLNQDLQRLLGYEEIINGELS